MVQSAVPVDIYVVLVSGTVALVLLVLGVVAFLFIYQKRIVQQELAVKEMEIRYQQDVIYRTLDAVEDERKRVARDLHDEVGAALSAMRLLVDQLARPDSTIPPAEGLSTKFKEVIDHTIDSVRRISNDLLPQGLDELGLAYALEGLCENVMDLAEVEVALHVALDVPGRTSLIVYRLVQELLNNTLKHAKATQIELALHRVEHELVLQYADNGNGFDFDQAYQQRSLGLKNIEARARMLNGTVLFDTQPGRGMSVTVKMPLS